MIDTDECLIELGEFGRYQKLLLWFVLLPATIPCAFHAYLQIFLSIKPAYGCLEAADLSNLGKNQISNFSIDEKCKIFDGNYLEDSNNNTSVCRNGWAFDKSKYVSTVVTEWGLICEKDFIPTLALMVFGIGGLIGNYFFGHLQDTIGRKPSFFIYLLMEILFSIASIFATNEWTWMICRFLVGLTVPAILGTPMVLALEIVGPSIRTIVIILLNISFSIGLVLLSGVIYLVRDWRQLTLATALPFLLLFLYWWVMPESPRWLIAKKRFNEAEKILEKMAKINGTKFTPFNKEEFLKTNQTEETFSQKNYGICDLFKLPHLRVKAIIITFIWFTNTAVYVGLSYYAPALGEDEFFNFFLAGVVELPTYLVLWPAMETVGRRWILCISMTIGGLACIATILVQQNEAITLILYSIGKMGISSSFVVVPLVASELYPTVVRGLGMSFSGVVAQIGPILIPLVNYMGEEWFVLPLIVMGALLVTGGICSLLLPETLRQRLPQTLEDGNKSSG